MAEKYTEEQLNKLDKDMLIKMYLLLQEQMVSLNKNMELVLEQLTVLNRNKYGKKSTDKKD